MKVIFTCGGTAGHVNPALAIAGLMRGRIDDVEILFVGSVRGMEGQLIKKAGYPFRAIEIDNFRRSFSLSGLRHNLHTAALVMKTRSQAREIIEEFRPDLIVGTGGYASYPMIKYGAKAGIPTAIHESNTVPGLTTKTLEPLVQKVMVGFEACRAYYAHPEKVIVTGTPVRGEFFALDRDGARRKLGIPDDKPLLVSFWGSLGATHMNERMLDFIRMEVKAGCPFRHIHAAGSRDWEMMREKLKESAIDLSHTDVEVREYIYDMPTVLRAADFVISRGGASTISELTALGMPSLIVPSPYVVNDHQTKNARVLEEAGGICMVAEAESSGALLYDTALEILSDRARHEKMRRAMRALAVPDAAERIYRTVMSLAEHREAEEIPPA